MTMSPRVRKFALAVHLTVSVGWIGAVAAYMALDVAATTSEDVHTLRTAYLGMDSIAGSVIVPLAVASLVTGVVSAVQRGDREHVRAEKIAELRLLFEGT
jgi:hypothetical protein